MLVVLVGDEGQAYVFTSSGGTTWSQIVKLTASDAVREANPASNLAGIRQT